MQVEDCDTQVESVGAIGNSHYEYVVDNYGDICKHLTSLKVSVRTM